MVGFFNDVRLSQYSLNDCRYTSFLSGFSDVKGTFPRELIRGAGSTCSKEQYSAVQFDDNCLYIDIVQGNMNTMRFNQPFKGYSRTPWLFILDFLSALAELHDIAFFLTSEVVGVCDKWRLLKSRGERGMEKNSSRRSRGWIVLVHNICALATK